MDPATTTTETASTNGTEAAGAAPGEAEGTPPGVEAQAAGDAAPGASQAASTEGGEGAPAEGGQAPAAGKPKINLTARLAEISRRARMERQASRVAISEATKARQAAESRLATFDSLAARAKAGDEAAIDEIYSAFGVSFEQIVNREARRGEAPTPEQKQASDLAAIRKELDDLKKYKEDAETNAVKRAEAQARANHVAGIVAHIRGNPEAFELCGRNPQEAADDVIAEVTKAWEKAGRPRLQQGEFDEAVIEAIKLTELRYEERGKRYTKTPKNGKPNGAPSPAAGEVEDKTGLPVGLTTASAKLSDKGEDIVRGLIDRTAPGEESPRAKPRTINSNLGGGAPPARRVDGSMDPREALREVTAPLVRQTFGR